MSSSYQSFAEIGEDNNHVLIHVLPSESKSGPHSWQHYIHDLDDFFTKVYRYHKRSGFACIVWSHILELIQIIFVVSFTIFLLHCIDYNILFKNKFVDPEQRNAKVRIHDVIVPLDWESLSFIEIFLLIISILFWLLKLIRGIQSIVVNLAIKSFYSEALHVTDCTLFTWQDIQTKLIQAQHFCLIQDGHLNELVIHNRILRHSNYMIAMVNKGLLPIHYKIPLLGEITYLTKGLQYNMQLLLFKGPFSLFEFNWKLKDEIKITSQRQQCADQLAKNCLLLAIINTILLPLILIWQILYTFYTYAEAIKRDPSMALGTRNWSLYARWYCRHFNELDHQLDDRLNRGYKAATKYMNSFTSPLLEVIFKHIAFIAGSILAILICLTIYDEDVITVEHLITVMTALGGIVAISRAFISSEIPSKYTHSELHTNVLEHIHYKPHGYAPYSNQARTAMGNIFPYKIEAVLEELISPIVTPYILIRHMRSRSLEIIDFFHNYTVEVAGTGDVCTFAMMNIKEHGNPQWKASCDSSSSQKGSGPGSGLATGQAVLPITQMIPEVPSLPQQLVTENGKLELSLINFKLTNPKWNPYNESQQQFINNVTSNCAIKEEPSTSRSESSSSRSQFTSVTPFPSRSTSVYQDQDLEKCTFNKERERLLNDLGHFGSEHEERAAAMSLSTLFLHQYASSHNSGFQRQNQHTEHDPLLSSS